MTDESNIPRRTVLKSSALFGVSAAGLVPTGVVGSPDEDPEASFVTLRETAGTISFEEILKNRREKLAEYGMQQGVADRKQSKILTIPEDRENIVAYNFGLVDGRPVEYYGYRDDQSQTTVDAGSALAAQNSGGAEIERIHEKADAHVSEMLDRNALQDQQRLTAASSSTDQFSDWGVSEGKVDADRESSEGNIHMSVDLYRHHDDNVSPDAYGIVSYCEMGGEEMSGVEDGVRNAELTVTHDWASNADMENDSRFPSSDVTGQISESWSVSISYPSGGSVTGGTTFTQPNVRTYDESDPWDDLGKWRVEIDSTHTEMHTAHANPGSVGIVDREYCKLGPGGIAPVGQPVGQVGMVAHFVNPLESEDNWNPKEYDKTMSHYIYDSMDMCETYVD